MNLTNLKLNGVWCFVLSLVLGWGIAGLDYRATEVQGTVILLVLVTASLGFLHPDGAWRWALITGCGILLLHGFARALGFRPVYPVRPNQLALLIPLIPSLIGAYGGVLLRKLVTPP